MSLQNAPDPAGLSPSFRTVDPVTKVPVEEFVDRRKTVGAESDHAERRQFGSSHSGLSNEGRELALAIDQYKVVNHRRYLTCDEMLRVISTLGYRKDS